MKRLKSWMAIVVVAMLVFNAVPARSQTSFILGAVFGALLFGDGDQTGTAATIIYTVPEVSKRVKNPLEIRMVSIQGSFSEDYGQFIGRHTLRELFEKSVKDSKKYEILQVVRVFKGDSPQYAAIWFAYIERENLLSLK